MKKLETYIDYRQFLLDTYLERKKRSKSYSYRTFNQSAGIKSPSLYKEVVEGKRNLTPETAAAFAKGLRLTARETHFFKTLVRFNQAQTEKEKLTCLEILRGFKPFVKQTIIPFQFYEYYSKWHHSVVREVACTFNFKDDYLKLAHALRPHITKRQARESMELLLRLGFLKKNKEGSYTQTNPSITTGAEVISPAVRALNREYAAMGKDAIDGYSPEKRDISTLVLGVSKESMEKIKQEIREFKHRLFEIVNEDPDTDRVYALNTQFFPLSDTFPLKPDGFSTESVPRPSDKSLQNNMNHFLSSGGQS